MTPMQKITRRAFLILSLGLAAGFGTAHGAATAGKEYRLLDPAQPTSSSSQGKVEVLEFFSYGCNHCRDLEPLFEKWQKKAPKDVAVKRVPVAFGAPWVPLQKMYLTLEALGEAERLNTPVFAAVHNENVRMQDEKVQLEWVVKNGVDRKKYQEMYNSFAIDSATKQAQKMTKDYKIEGIPALSVAGRYLTSASFAGSHESALKVVDELIVKSRPAPGKK